MLLPNKVIKKSGFSIGLKGGRVSQAKAKRNGSWNGGRVSQGPTLWQSVRPGRTQDTVQAARASWKHITERDTQSENQNARAQVPPLPLSVTLIKFLNFASLYKMVIPRACHED